jgi:hypothetical protein
MRWRHFQVVATREDMKLLLEGISAGLEQPESALRDRYLPKEAPTPVWKGFATEANKQTDRVTLEFCVAPDLDRYHSKRKIKREELKNTVLFVTLLTCTSVGALFLAWQLFRLGRWVITGS